MFSCDNNRFSWSEWGDSNSRHLEPKSSALPTGPHPDIYFFFLRKVVKHVVKFHFLPPKADHQWKFSLAPQRLFCFPGRLSTSRAPAPKGRRNIFSDSSRPFPILSAPMSPAFPTSYLHCFQVLRAGLWSDMWSNAAFRPTAAILAAAASGGLSLSTGIVAQENRLCNWFLLVQCLQDLVHWKQRIHSPFQSCAA